MATKKQMVTGVLGASFVENTLLKGSWYRGSFKNTPKSAIADISNKVNRGELSRTKGKEQMRNLIQSANSVAYQKKKGR